MRPRVRRRTAFLVVLSTLLVAACGGGDDGGDGDGGQAATPQQAGPLSPTPQGPRDLPARIPLKGTVPGDPAAIKVIRLWSEALRRSDVKAASALWAVPSKVQNGTPVIPLATVKDVQTFNGSLSCGSQLVSGLGAKGSAFTVAVFKLTKRPGADCGTGTGQRARTAIRVRDGKIAEWYRLPDDPDGAPDTPALPQEPDAPII